MTIKPRTMAIDVPAAWASVSLSACRLHATSLCKHGWADVLNWDPRNNKTGVPIPARFDAAFAKLLCHLLVYLSFQVDWERCVKETDWSGAAHQEDAHYADNRNFEQRENGMLWRDSWYFQQQNDHVICYVNDKILHKICSQSNNQNFILQWTKLN